MTTRSGLPSSQSLCTPIVLAFRKEGYSATWIRWALMAVLGAVLIREAWAVEESQPPQGDVLPNVVLIYTDDQGYADLGCYGASTFATPNLDRMAAEGMRWTDFYVAQAVCSASRAALLTGCYPNRIGIRGALGPGSKVGIAESETTLAELLRDRGYRTAIYGKWHLGHREPFLPTRHGFEEYYGLPYSNDMWPFHPTNPNFPPLPLIEGEEVIETNPDQTRLTGAYAERTVQFIETHANEPFFVYLAHNMPHVPLFASESFVGRTEQGLYGDVIGEVDDSVGKILDTLERLRLDERTLVIFASDNGPWLSYGDHAGSAEPLREGKGTSFDGGVRVPCLMWWPGRIGPGTTQSAPAMTIDLLPTIAALVDAPLPTHPIDGVDLSPWIFDGSTAIPHDALAFYWGGELQALRAGRWKLHFPHEYRSLAGEPGSGGRPSPYKSEQIEWALFDLEDDAGESVDRSSDHPEIVLRLRRLAERFREQLGDSRTGVIGSAIRQPGRVSDNN